MGARSGDSWQRSLAMCTDDFDEDGVPDIVVGFAGSSGGGLMFLRGNVDAIHPNTLEGARAAHAAGASVYEPFLPAVQLADTADAPELLVAGDFDNDGHRDVAYAAQGAEVLRIATGNGRGAFGRGRSIPLPGAIRSLASGELGRADGLLELFVEVDEPEGESSKGGVRSLVLGAYTALPVRFREPSSRRTRFTSLPRTRRKPHRARTARFFACA
ncbi:MAG: VCBS repeat-containing protein [Blastocatellia bacterium]|nr:VCBS repeat-containing protein [Blastocatellia bacterium]